MDVVNKKDYKETSYAKLNEDGSVSEEVFNIINVSSQKKMQTYAHDMDLLGKHATKK